MPQSLLVDRIPAASRHSVGRHEKISAQHLAIQRQVPNRDIVAEWSRLWSLSLACNLRLRKTNCPNGSVFRAAPLGVTRQPSLSNPHSPSSLEQWPGPRLSWLLLLPRLLSLRAHLKGQR